MKLQKSFYLRNDVTAIAKDLLGKCLFTRIDGKRAGGIIVETEAYSPIERGSHAFGNRVTARNQVMFGQAGYAYVYLCYGIHNLFNVVTNDVGKADAVLIRALEPVDGLDTMLKRMGASGIRRITSGPGKLTKALGIDRTFNGHSLSSRELWLSDQGVEVSSRSIEKSERIGIDYAGKDAKLPWRFTIKGSIWVSK